MENETLGVTIFIACVSLICLITFSLDIPCALRGGQEMYVNELPSYIGFGRFRRTITDNEELKHLNVVFGMLMKNTGIIISVIQR